MSRVPPLPLRDIFTSREDEYLRRLGGGQQRVVQGDFDGDGKSDVKPLGKTVFAITFLAVIIMNLSNNVFRFNPITHQIVMSTVIATSAVLLSFFKYLLIEEGFQMSKKCPNEAAKIYIYLALAFFVGVTIILGKELVNVGSDKNLIIAYLTLWFIATIGVTFFNFPAKDNITTLSVITNVKFISMLCGLIAIILYSIVMSKELKKAKNENLEPVNPQDPKRFEAGKKK